MLKGNLELLDELKMLLNIKSDIDLAEKIEVPINTIKNWKKKGEIPEKGQSLVYIKLYISKIKDINTIRDRVFQAIEIIDCK